MAGVLPGASAADTASAATVEWMVEVSVALTLMSPVLPVAVAVPPPIWASTLPRMVLTDTAPPPLKPSDLLRLTAMETAEALAVAMMVADLAAETTMLPALAVRSVTSCA